MIKQWYVLDFETFFVMKNDPRGQVPYTLTDMTSEEYVRDPRFEAQCLGIYNKDTHVVLPREAIPGWLARINWAETGVIMQNAYFDALILHEIYGVSPAFIIDLMVLSRYHWGLNVSHSLAAISERLGLGEKSVPYQLMAGRRWHEMPENTKALQASGCLEDCRITWDGARQLLPHIPQFELEVMDATARMYTEPMLVGDSDRLLSLVASEAKRKADALAHLGVTGDMLRKDKQFEAILHTLGVDIQYKQMKGGLKPAFAKTDPFMQELLESDDEVIRAVVEARLDEKSTIQITRAQRIYNMTQRGSGKLCIYYRAYGCVTNRWAGGEGYNWQNLPARGKNGSEIKQCIQAPRTPKAPKNYKVVVADAPQIECRNLSALAAHPDTQLFRENGDPYSRMAELVYGHPVDKNNHPTKRGTGKQLILGAGYGCGGKTFQKTALRGTYGPSQEIPLLECNRLIRVYRDTHTEICGWREGPRIVGGLWQRGDEWLEILASKRQGEFWAPREPGQPYANAPILRFKDGKMFLPGDRVLHYEGLYWGKHPAAADDDDEQEGWLLPKKKMVERMYGSHMVQHVVQALSCLQFSETVIRSNKRMKGWGRVCLVTHDDLGAVVPEDMAEEAAAIITEEMSVSPAWLPNAPHGCELEIRNDYAKK